VCLADARDARGSDVTRTATQAGPSQWRWAAVAACGAALISTVIFNVPINLATGRWNRDQPSEDWKRTRNRWELFDACALGCCSPGSC